MLHKKANTVTDRYLLPFTSIMEWSDIKGKT